MKINGKKIQRPKFEVIVFPRRDGDIIIKAQAVLSYEDFEKLCPPPVPPVVIRPNGTDEGAKTTDINHPKYIAAINDWSRMKLDWMILQSLKATEGLEFETVNPSDPDSWQNVHKELEEAGFSELERTKIIEIVVTACGLNQNMIDEATNNFLASQAAKRQNA